MQCPRRISSFQFWGPGVSDSIIPYILCMDMNEVLTPSQPRHVEGAGASIWFAMRDDGWRWTGWLGWPMPHPGFHPRATDPGLEAGAPSTASPQSAGDFRGLLYGAGCMSIAVEGRFPRPAAADRCNNRSPAICRPSFDDGPSTHRHLKIADEPAIPGCMYFVRRHSRKNY